MNRKSLHAAVLSALVASGVASNAEAVHINPDGLGQILIFPYYTARAGQFTAIQIVNTQNNTKAVKLRFLEGRNGREVLSFNFFMSPNDAWTGAVIATANGAKVISNDNSCVAPSDLFTETRKDALGVQFLNEFKNYDYTGNLASSVVDNPTMNSLDRTREGYFEVIEMGVIDDDLITGNTMNAFNNTQFVTAFIKHNSAGVPANCAAVDGYDANSLSTTRFPNVGANGTLMQPPRGGLAGRASIINAATGANYTFLPTAIGGWSASVQYSASGSRAPDLSAANPPVSNVITDNGSVSTTWATGRDAMSAVLMRNTVQNEFILDVGTQSQTDWIVTFPTKRYHVNVGTSLAGPSGQPFANSFHNTVNDGSCDPYGSSTFNREEQTTPPPPIEIRPGTPVDGPIPERLCWTANVVPFGATSLLSSTNTNPLILSVQTFVIGATSLPASSTTPSIRGTQGPNGWLMMNFDSTTQVLAPVSAVLMVDGVPAPVPLAFGRHRGLPVVGAMLHNYLNTGVASRYGGVLEHRFTRNIN